jgi:hypothetical protein
MCQHCPSKKKEPKVLIKVGSCRLVSDPNEIVMNQNVRKLQRRGIIFFWLWDTYARWIVVGESIIPLDENNKPL